MVDYLIKRQKLKVCMVSETIPLTKKKKKKEFKLATYLIFDLTLCAYVDFLTVCFRNMD